jgi:hypothetical protein
MSPKPFIVKPGDRSAVSGAWACLSSQGRGAICFQPLQSVVKWSRSSRGLTITTTRIYSGLARLFEAHGCTASGVLLQAALVL